MSANTNIDFKFIAYSVPGLLVLGGIVSQFFCSSGGQGFCDNAGWMIGLGILLFILELLFKYGDRIFSRGY
jgi:hypothetical protein